MTLKKFLLCFVVFLLMLTIPLSTYQDHNKSEAFSPRILQKGSSGDDVIELQARLQYLGFYKGKIDGLFGWGTYWAVRNFQKEFSLDIDGLVGEETKAKLRKASKYDKKWVYEQLRSGKEFTYYGGTSLDKQTKKKKQGTGGQSAQQQQAEQGQKQEANQGGGGEDTPPQPTSVNVPSGYSQNDIKLLANAVYGEARGESYVGQVAIAAVILNRVESPTFPNTVSGVIFEPRAFTAVSDGQIWLEPNDKARRAVMDALNGMDPSGNALYYFNPDTATSDWIWSRPQIKKIGKHIFCK
ncbi:spore cortex-lytic enzyme [Salinibacillus xinjiangensis]|uniref:Spore cortex-lytic enzyme n=1 Tax=Salinibacillus xinjiangensis TaxID=1229268 RepID=A0A6G1X631_9BACI|nr:spore cortex-lytic enzyme [Salinibacillus xinjiangensis]MRG86424.1 spore cortex-lytic enzyme [Salinibacillus xinjiangensis]